MATNDLLPEKDAAASSADTDAAQVQAEGTEQTQPTGEVQPEVEQPPVYTVPLDRYIQERATWNSERDRIAREAEELRAFRAAAEKELLEWRGLGPAFQQTWQEKEQIASQKAELEAQLAYYKETAAQNGLQVDERALRSQLAQQQQAQQFQQFPQLIQSLPQTIAQTVAQEMDRRERARAEAEAKATAERQQGESWKTGWDEVIKSNPRAAFVEGVVKQAWQAQGGKVSPREIMAAFTGDVGTPSVRTNTPTQATGQPRLPTTLSGSSPGTRPTVADLAAQQQDEHAGESLEGWIKRIRRDRSQAARA